MIVDIERNMLDLSFYAAEVLSEIRAPFVIFDGNMCLTKLLVMKKVIYMVIAFAMALAGLFMLMFMSFD